MAMPGTKSTERRKQYQRAWRERNREKARQASREWRERNHEYLLEYRRQRRLENIEEQRRKEREYYLRNRERIVTRQREWHEKNKAKVREYRRRRCQQKHTSVLETKPLKTAKVNSRCKVNKSCRTNQALWWYDVVESEPTFTLISAEKPTKLAVPCCAACKAAIKSEIRTLQFWGGV